MSATFLKNIPPENVVIEPYKLYKTWVLDQTSFTNVNPTSGIIGVYNAIYSAGNSTIFPEYTPGYNTIVDMQGYPINVNYPLNNGTWFNPYNESIVPLNFPNGNVVQYAGGELRFVDGLYWGAPSGSTEIIGYTGRMIWYAIYNLFYRQGRNAQGVNYPPAVYYDEFDGTNTLYTSSAIVFDIPEANFGEGIVEGSFEMILAGTAGVGGLPYSSIGNTAGNVDIYDNGSKNLYDSYNTKYSGSIGNISYDKGLVIITDQEYYRFMSSSMCAQANTASLAANLSYTSYITTHQHTYMCLVKSHEFNTTSNPTAYAPSQNPNNNGENICIFDNMLDPDGNSVNFRPLATAIGLYDDSSNLVAIAKFANPVRIENDIDSIFVVRFDM